MPELNTLKGHYAKIRDKFRFRGDTDGSHKIMGNVLEISFADPMHDSYKDQSGASLVSHKPLWEKVTDTVSNKPSGGPSSYYDFPFKDWVTVNDMLDYLSEKQWGWRSYIFKDIVKACTRWGSKDGTTHEYDAKKIIYYGARLLMSVTSKTTLRKYLQELLDDKQFQENDQ